MKSKIKKPKNIYGKSLLNDLTIKVIKDPLEIIKIKTWNSEVGLTPIEVINLHKWLTKALPYIKKKEI